MPQSLFKCDLKIEGLEDVREMFSSDLIRKAIRSSLDRSGTWGKNLLSDSVSENYNIKSSAVKKAIKVERTTQNNLCMSIITRGPALSLIDYFNAVQDASGVTAKIDSDWIKRTPHAFINRARNSGKRVVMLRTGKPRYPTTGKAGWGPPIPALLKRSRVIEKNKEKIIDHIFEEFKNQIGKRSTVNP